MVGPPSLRNGFAIRSSDWSNSSLRTHYQRLPSKKDGVETTCRSGAPEAAEVEPWLVPSASDGWPL